MQTIRKEREGITLVMEDKIEKIYRGKIDGI